MAPAWGIRAPPGTCSSFPSILQMGTFKGERRNSLFLSANVKPRYHKIKSNKSGKTKNRPKENEFLIACSRSTK